MNKLAEFPLERSGLGDAPDDTVIVAWPAWSLTVGDVRRAMEKTAPQAVIKTWQERAGLQAGVSAALCTDVSEDMQAEIDDLRSLLTLARATPQHSVTEHASECQYPHETDECLGCGWKYKPAVAQPLASTAAQPEQASEILGLHRRLAAETLRADHGWQRADAKSKECIELRERAALASPASTAPTEIEQAVWSYELQQDAPYQDQWVSFLERRPPNPAQNVRNVTKYVAIPASTAANCGNSHQSPYETAGQPALGIGDVIVTAASEQQAGADERAQRRNSSGNAIVYVCPERDVECGRNQKSWCAKCPQHAALTHRATTAADQQGDKESGKAFRETLEAAEMLNNKPEGWWQGGA